MDFPSSFRVSTTTVEGNLEPTLPLGWDRPTGPGKWNGRGRTESLHSSGVTPRRSTPPPGRGRPGEGDGERRLLFSYETYGLILGQDLGPGPVCLFLSTDLSPLRPRTPSGQGQSRWDDLQTVSSTLLPTLCYTPVTRVPELLRTRKKGQDSTFPSETPGALGREQM